MGKLDEYKKNNPNEFKPQQQGERKPVVNLLVKISGYELGGTIETNYVLGTRVDTGENVKVRLYEIEQSKNSGYSRIEIAQFGHKRDAKRVSEENFMVFEQAREEVEGVFAARWAVPLDRTPKNTSAFVMLASLRHGVIEKDGQKNEWFQIKMLYNIPPLVVNSVEELENGLAKFLKPKFPGSNPQAIIRITDDEGEKMTIDVLPLREEIVEDDGYTFKRVVEDPLRSVANFKETKADRYKMVAELISEPDVKIEIIGAASLYPGTATKDKLTKLHEHSKKHLVQGFYVNKDANVTNEAENAEEGEKPAEDTPNNANYPEIGYHFCVIGTRMHADGTPYLTYIKPFQEYTPASSINDIQEFSLKK